MDTAASGGLASVYSLFKGEYGRTRISQGTVVRYDSLAKLYTVNVDGDATRVCRRLCTGVERPAQSGSRVLLLKNYGVDWIILGELEKARVVVPADGGSATDQAAQQERDFNADPNTLPEVGFRSIDADGVSEEPLIVGDAVFENLTDKNVSRSFVRLYSFGDVYIKASHLCFELFSKSRNTIVRRARDLRTSAFGYIQNITTDTRVDAGGATTVDEQIKAKVLDITNVIWRLSGTVPARPAEADKSFARTPIVLEGSREETGKFLVVERDAVTETVRFEQRMDGQVFMTGAIGGLKNSDALVPASLSSASGLGLKFGSFEISYNPEADRLEIASTAKLGSKLVMTEDRFAIECGGQKLEFTESGMKIVSNNLETTVSGNQTTNVAGQVEETASGARTIKAAIINLN
jgi:hypothetical protein